MFRTRSKSKPGRKGTTCLGFVLLIIGLLWGLASWAASISGLRAAGTVTALVANSGHHAIVYAPRVRFTAEGSTHEFTSKLSENPAGYEVGQQVRVFYPPGYPEAGEVDSFEAKYLFPALLCAAGTILLGVAMRL